MSLSKLYVNDIHTVLPNEEALNLSTIMYLNINKFEYVIKQIPNVSEASPTGLTPFLVQQGNKLSAGIPAIYASIKLWQIKRKPSQGDSVEESNPQKSAEKEIKLLWILDFFQNLLMFLSWFSSDDNYFLSKAWYGKQYSFPLNHILPLFKFNKIKKYFIANDWIDKKETDLLNEFDAVCFGISEMIGKGPYLFSADNPDQLDAVLCGHLLVVKKIPCLAEILKNYCALLDYSNKLYQEYFYRPAFTDPNMKSHISRVVSKTNDQFQEAFGDFTEYRSKISSQIL